MMLFKRNKTRKEETGSFFVLISDFVFLQRRQACNCKNSSHFHFYKNEEFLSKRVKKAGVVFDKFYALKNVLN